MLTLFYLIKKGKKNQKVPVNKYDVRLNTDWRPVVFPSRHPAVLKIMLIFCNVKFRKTKQNQKRKKQVQHCEDEGRGVNHRFCFCRILKDNRHLHHIQEDAFEGAAGPTVL